jgi:ribonuclease-3
MIAYVHGKGPRDYKTILQERASAEVHSVPDYRIRERGPDHQKEFTATVFLAGTEWGSGTGRSKKEAEQQAAHQAYVRLERAEQAEPDDAWEDRGTQETGAQARAVAPRKKGA